MRENIPEFLVKIEYKEAGDRYPRVTYYTDTEGERDSHYEKALKQFHPNATIVSLTRRVRPIHESMDPSIAHCS